jgi:putative transposase
MKLTIQLQLLPSDEQLPLLLNTMEQVNEAANFAARIGFENDVFNQASIHKLAYYEIRERFKLSSQLAVHAVLKAAYGFSRNKDVCPEFRAHGAITYDDRNISFKGSNKISLATINGRQKIPIVYGEYQAERFDRIKGQCDLVYRDGKFFLMATVDIPETPPLKVKAFLGVDLGIVNLATDSEGEAFSGEQVNRNRRRRATARKQYQRRGTKSAKRRLKAMSGRQRRFQTITNHVISKTIVISAKALGLGIAMEDLTNIRDRIEATVSRRFRRRFGNWGFCQLREFVKYKAQLAGVPFILINPRNTSRTCSKCGHCEKANRKSQAEFVCKQCGFSMNADKNAAINIAVIGLTEYNAALETTLGPNSKLAPKVATAQVSDKAIDI